MTYSFIVDAPKIEGNSLLFLFVNVGQDQLGENYRTYFQDLEGTEHFWQKYALHIQHIQTPPK